MLDQLEAVLGSLHEYIHVEGAFDELRGLILDHAFSGALTNSKHGDRPVSTFMEEVGAHRWATLTANGARATHNAPMWPELPYELPARWTWATLGELCSVVVDGDHGAPPQVETGIPFLVISDVRGRRLDPMAAGRRVPPDYYNSLDWAHKPLTGDILYTVTGSYGIPVPVETVEAFCFQRHIALLRPAVPTLTTYLDLFLQSPAALRLARSMATGIAQKTVPLGKLRRMPVPVAPLEEQERLLNGVVPLLAQIEDLRESYNAAEGARRHLSHAALCALGEGDTDIALMNLHTVIRTPADVFDLQAAITKLALSGVLTEDDPEPDSPNELSCEVRAYGDDVVTLGSVADLTYGPAFKSQSFAESGGMPLIRIRDILPGRTKTTYLGEYDDRYIVREGDILVGMDGNFNCRSWPGPPALLNQRVARIRPREDCLLGEYLLLVLPERLRYIQSNISSTTVTHLSAGALSSISFVLPPLSEQEAVVARTAELLSWTGEALHSLAR
jgi:hypothetical protein